MIENIKINNFRGIKELTIENLGQINIILGKNNCGKTSLLDAILLLSGATNPRLPITINWARNYSNMSDEMFRINFYGLEPKNKIRLSGKYNHSKERNLTISYREERSEIIGKENDTLDIHYYLNLEAEISGKKYHTELKYPGNDTTSASVSDIKDEEYTEELKTFYISSSDPFNNNKQLFTNLLLDKQEHAIIESLRTIEPNLKDIIVANDNLYADIGLEKRIPIQVLGDGIRKIISILINIYQAKDGGVLLIDEIDNGLHYQSMPTLWKTILWMANKYNVQIFATTHNIDSLRALKNELSESLENSNMQDKTHIYTLRKKQSGDMMAFMNEYSQFTHLINTETEIR